MNTIWHKKCTRLVMKIEKRHKIERIELSNSEKKRTLGEKETYKYLGILEDDTIKQVETKEKNLKTSISVERERYSRQNYIAGIS